MDLIVKNGKIVNCDGEREADIFVKNQKIETIAPNIQIENQKIQTIDARGKYIFPGGIDPHVHHQLPTPAGPTSDDFYSGSRAALFGCTTTIIDFVTPHRGQSLTDALKARLGEASKSIINTRLHVSPVEWRSSTEGEILDCIQNHNIKSFKCYMAYKNNVGLDDDSLFKVMKVVGKAGGLVTLHCEDGDEIEKLRTKYFDESLPGPEAHVKSRPPKLEAKAVKKAIGLAAKANCPIYIVHVSSAQSLQLIKAAQQAGQIVYAETCPQYLLLDQSKYLSEFEKAVAFVISPPLRNKEDNLALWQALADGAVSTVGTDHCPFMLSQKMAGKDDFRKIPNGAGGIEHRMALLYTYGVLENKIDLKKFVEITSTNAAKVFGLYPQKGIIAEGADADLVVWNPETENTISVNTHHQNCDLNIYEGFKTKGTPEVVILGGKVVLSLDGRG